MRGGRKHATTKVGLMQILPEHEDLSTGKSRFWALDPLTTGPWNTCDICQSNASLLRYEVLASGAAVTGGCCLRCFPNLLRKVRRCDSGRGQTNKQCHGKVAVNIESWREAEPWDSRCRGRQARGKPLSR